MERSRAKAVIVAGISDNLSSSCSSKLRGGVMGRAYTLAKVYPVSAQTLWADILDPNALAESMKGAFSYFGLVSEPVFEGQRIVVSIKRWGWFPMGKWTMDVVKRDDERHILESREFGSLVRTYRHRLEVETLSEHESRYTDTDMR